MWKKLAATVGLISASALAHADLLNISANGVHSSTLSAGACAIVGTTGPLYRGYKWLYVYGEAAGNGFNPTLRVNSLKYNISMVNDDWQSSYVVNGTTYAPIPSALYAFLRAPNRSLDAAVIFLADPSEPFCAFTNEVAANNNLYQVNISVTDMTATLATSGPRLTEMKDSADAEAAVQQMIDRFIEMRSSRPR